MKTFQSLTAPSITLIRESQVHSEVADLTKVVGQQTRHAITFLGMSVIIYPQTFGAVPGQVRTFFMHLLYYNHIFRLNSSSFQISGKKNVKNTHLCVFVCSDFCFIHAYKSVHIYSESTV